MQPPILFSLGLANYPLIYGLAAASAPLIIHLLNRRKFREVPWAAMRFLLAAVRKNSRRIQIEQWLLLAVRTLVIILVVTAMAKPFLESLGGIGAIAGQRTHGFSCSTGRSAWRIPHPARPPGSSRPRHLRFNSSKTRDGAIRSASCSWPTLRGSSSATPPRTMTR